MNYQIKLFSELNDDLKSIWLKVEEDSYNTCFNSFSWIKNYASIFQKDLKLRIFVIFFKNEPICIVPLEIIKRFKTNVAQWVCDSKSDYNIPLQKKNFKFDKESFDYIWKKILTMIPEADIIYLKKQMNFSDTLKNPLINFLRNVKEGVIEQIILPNKWKKYTEDVLKKKFYQDLLRTKRLIKKNGKVEFVIAKTKKEKEFFIDALINQKKLSLLKNNANFLSNKDMDFYKNFEKYDDKKYVTQISAVKFNDEFVAMHWGVIFGNCFYYLLPSMQMGDVKKFAPGKLLLSLLIRWSISKKLMFFDFGLGEESYKKNWSNKKTDIYSYTKLKRLKGIPLYLALVFKQKIKQLKNY